MARKSDKIIKTLKSPFKKMFPSTSTIAESEKRDDSSSPLPRPHNPVDDTDKMLVKYTGSPSTTDASEYTMDMDEESARDASVSPSGPRLYSQQGGPSSAPVGVAPSAPATEARDKLTIKGNKISGNAKSQNNHNIIDARESAQNFGSGGATKPVDATIEDNEATTGVQNNGNMRTNVNPDLLKALFPTSN